MQPTGATTVGLAITTVGRPEIARLLESAAESTLPPAAVAIANQSGRPLNIVAGGYPFPVRIVTSSGGVSAGRNAAVRNLAVPVDIIGFPNDDSYYPASSLQAAVESFNSGCPLDAIACSLVERGWARFVLPPDGRTLDRSSVWRAIEPAFFIRMASFLALHGFREDIGTGAPSPWQSGEGTDLLLRVMAAGGRVVSRPQIEVYGPGERRDLTADSLVARHRRYARGTGHLYRIHPYPTHIRLRTLLGPIIRIGRHDTKRVLSLRLALARSLGRLEGLLGHQFGKR